MRDVMRTSEYGNCIICPRACGADRTSGGRGFCGMGPVPVVNLYSVHRGEEPSISGTRGSGTVFFEGCSLKCVFCQNYDISRGPTGAGREYSSEELASLYLELQSQDTLFRASLIRSRLQKTRVLTSPSYSIREDTNPSNPLRCSTDL